MLSTRKIVHIDEEKCDGCGVCVPSCHEGALQIIDGKAKLVTDAYCDGLGDCLGHCPQDAITIIEREAVDFDEAAVEAHLAKMKAEESVPEQSPCGCPGSAMQEFKPEPEKVEEPEPLPCGCPGSSVRSIEKETSEPAEEPVGAPARSQLSTWPVQIMLIPPTAPFLQGADLLITADCVPFALPNYHSRFLKDKIALVGCPKLDNIQLYRAKFEEIFKVAKPKSVTVLRMEVPCCSGIVQVAHEALQAAAPETPFHVHVVGVQGGVHELSHV